MENAALAVVAVTGPAPQPARKAAPVHSSAETMLRRDLPYLRGAGRAHTDCRCMTGCMACCTGGRLSLERAGPVRFDESAASRLALFGRVDARRGSLIDQNVTFSAVISAANWTPKASRGRFGTAKTGRRVPKARCTKVGQEFFESGSPERVAITYDHSNHYLWMLFWVLLVQDA